VALDIAANVIAGSAARADDQIVLRRFDLRPADAAVWACWLAALAAFIALAAAVHAAHPTAFDERATLWVQDLDRFAWADAAFSFANNAGGFDAVAAVAVAMLGVLLVLRLRFEALIVAGVLAARALQLAVRHSIDWPAGQAEYFYTTHALPDGGSFPSGHVLGQALVYGLLFAFAPRIFASRAASIGVRALCVTVIALGAPARMYTGAHWPSDLIGAALLASLYLVPVLWADARWQRRLRLGAERALAASGGLTALPVPDPIEPGPATAMRAAPVAARSANGSPSRSAAPTARST
jgi:undecaprenyl-diphosphatase